MLEIPKNGKVTVKSLAINPKTWNLQQKVSSVRLVGGSWWNNRLKFTRDEAGLHIALPEKLPSQTALALKIQS